MVQEEKFNEIYQELLAQKDEIEEMRKNAYNEKEKLYIIMLVSIAIPSLILYVLLEFTDINPMWIILLVLIAAVVVCFKIVKLSKQVLKKNKPLSTFDNKVFMFLFETFLGKYKNEYKEGFKEKVMKSMVKAINQQLEYMPQEGISIEDFIKSKFAGFHKYETKDLISGTLENGNKFEMANYYTYFEHADSEGHTYEESTFEGLFVKVELKKSFNGQLYVKKDNGKDKKMLSGGLSSDKLRLQLDSPEFEKIFDVRTSNSIMTMQLLTADIMEDLVALYNELKVNYEITIEESCMYIGFQCGELFKPEKLEKFSLNREKLYESYRVLVLALDLTNKLAKALDEI